MNLVKQSLNKPFYRFLLFSGLCYIIWFLLYDLWLKNEGSLDDFLGFLTAEAAIRLMNVFDYQVSYITEFRLHFFYYQGSRILQMVPACNGQVLYALYSGFIIATPGKLKHKLLMTGIGFLAIFFVNCLRVIGLCLIKIHSPQYLAFNHKYTFTILVYGCIFGLWMIWINYFTPNRSTNAS